MMRQVMMYFLIILDPNTQPFFGNNQKPWWSHLNTILTCPPIHRVFRLVGNRRRKRGGRICVLSANIGIGSAIPMSSAILIGWLMMGFWISLMMLSFTAVSRAVMQPQPTASVIQWRRSSQSIRRPRWTSASHRGTNGSNTHGDKFHNTI